MVQILWQQKRKKSEQGQGEKHWTTFDTIIALGDY
jgi:hypothetical protein